MRRKSTALLFSFVVSLFILSVPVTSAASRNVPSAYPSIQAAINASTNGDIIYVSPGTYSGCITIDGKYISLVATNSDPNATVITGCPGRTIVMIQHVPYVASIPRVTVSGFRIANGYSPDGQGGGITVANSADPIIENSYFVGNRGSVDAGAIMVYNNSSPVIKNNLFDSNSAARLGGAVMVVKSSSPVLIGNTFTNNVASGGAIPGGGPSGGAIYLENDPSNNTSRVKVAVVGNVISHNTADHAGGGIMVRVGVDALIEDNTISYNTAAYGAGIHLETEGSYPVVSNNTITNNEARFRSAYSGSGYGGGISVYNTSHPTISHNSIINNVADYGGGGIVMAENSSTTLDANTISSNNIANASSSTQLYGGGIYIANASMIGTNNIISGNTAGVGGGFASLDNSIYSLEQNTIANNTSVSSVNPASGGGVYVGSSPGTSANFVNNIISGNSNYQVFEGSQKGYFTNNLITNSGSGLYFNWSSGGITSSTTLDNSPYVNASGTIANDPKFNNAVGGDYSLMVGSPAIDAGFALSSITSDLRRADRPTGSGYDIGAYEYTTATDFKIPVYRFWSSENHGHFYTSSKTERDSIMQNYAVQGWQYESEVYTAYSTNVAGTTPLYRFWSSTSKGHFYTADPAERDYILANYTDAEWHYEGIAYYVLDLGSSKGTPVYRFWSPVYMHHFYTADPAERDYVQATMPSTWTYEGARFRVP